MFFGSCHVAIFYLKFKRVDTYLFYVLGGGEEVYSALKLGFTCREYGPRYVVGKG